MSLQNTNVPKFGDWDGSIPYTQYFEVARRGKSGSKTNNQNDPCDNHEAFSTNAQLVSAHSPRDGGYSPTMRPKNEMHVSGEGNPHRRISRGINGSNYTINHSSLHPCKMNNGGYSSSDGLSAENQALTSKSPGRLRMHGIEDDKMKINKGSALPKFGEWDESNPSSADGFTGVFNKVREGNQLSSTTVRNGSSAETDANYHGSTDESLGCRCFAWCKK